MDENLANDEREAFESQAPGFYSGSGRGSSSKTSRLKSILKKKGPLVAILGLIGGIGSLMMGAQTLMPVAIEEMIIEKFNSIGISSTMASDKWLDTQLNQGVRLENLETGQTENLFAFSEYQVQSFERQGIKVLNATDESNSVGGMIMALLYKKGDEWVPVVGSDFLKYNGYTEADLINAIKVTSGLDNIGAPVSAVMALNDPNFKKSYTTAAKGWRGGASGWFDKIMDNITETKLSINRNRWSRYIAHGINGMTDDFKKAAESAMKTKIVDPTRTDSREVSIKEGESLTVNESTYTTGDGEVLTVKRVTPVYDVDKNGDEFLRGYRVDSDDVDASVNGATSTSTLTNILNSKAVKVATAAANATCAVVEGMMSIYTVVSAYQSLQFLNLISGYLEAVDKVKAGDGDGSPVHTYSENLVTKADTVAVSYDESATETVVASKTAMESQGMSWLFGSKERIDPNDPSVQNTNLETIMTNISSLTGNVELTAEVFETCGYVKIATSTISLVTTIAALIPIVGGAVKVADITIKEVGKFAIKAVATAAFYIMIPIVAKKVANSLMKDAATEWFGEDLGNAMISGAGKYLGGNGTSGGQSPGSKDKVLAYLQERDTVIAEEAKYQRSIRSPFDASSQYTFLGNLAYSIMPLAYSGSSMMSSLKGVSNLTASSIIAMSPTASAIDKDSMLRSEGDCALAEGLGIVSDAYCNAYIITDVSTMSTSPVAVAENVHRSGNNEIASNNDYVGVASENFNNDGTIKKGSNLAKYITYCGQRTSQYGVKDAAIAEMVTGNSGASLLNYVPALSELVNIYNGLKDVTNMKWTTGEACVASEDNTMWEENKWYQRYAENERLLENINPGYKSTVTAYLEDYYMENPVDDSFEGQIARFAGMSKEDVTDTLALILYYDFLNEYDPSERYAFNGEAVEIERNDAIMFENENEEKFYHIWWYNNIYDRVGRAKAEAQRIEYTIC